MTFQTELIPTNCLQLGSIHRGDCIELMQQIETGTVDLVFSDPPFNIGYEYDQYHDRQEDEEYVAWSTKWMDEVYRILKPNGTFWLAIGDEFAAELKIAAQSIQFISRSWVVWYYTFGVNCKRKFSRSHVHLFHFVKDENNFTFNAEDPAVRVLSARALVYADKRANPNGRLPDDTWILRPQDLAHGFDTMDDTVYFARVAGTFAERQGFHGCQMPEQLLGRIVRVSSNPGDVVLDPFAGSGTTLAVAKKLGRKWIGCELSDEYVRAATERLAGIKSGEALDGPADPIASAPSTSNGRRLKEIMAEAIDEPIATIVDSPLVTTTTPTSELPMAPVPNSDSEVVSVSRESAPVSHAKRDLRDAIREAILEAFSAAHDGYSSDWLLASPNLQHDFHNECRKRHLIGHPVDWNHELLRLRKSGHLPKSEGLKQVQVTAEEIEAYRFASEIAWRITSEKFGGISLDEIFCDPLKGDWFDRTASRFAPGYAPEFYRWAALRMRKATKTLVSESKHYQYIYEKRDFAARPQKLSTFRFDRYVGQPGVYLLQGKDKCRLFVDRAQDLGARLLQHVECKAFTKEASHVALVPIDQLPGENYHELFKVDLVRRYSPELRLNVNLVGLMNCGAI